MKAFSYGQPTSAAATHPVYADSGVAPTLTTGTDTTPTAGTVYWSSLYLPCPRLLTGAALLWGSAIGTDKAIVSLYDALGNLVANSALAGTTSSTLATFQQIAFTSVYNAEHGDYIVGVSVDGTTCRLRLSVANGNRGGSVAGSFGTLAAALTVPTSNAAGPYMYVY